MGPCLFYFKALRITHFASPGGLKKTTPCLVDLLLDRPLRFSYIQPNQKGIGESILMML